MRGLSRRFLGAFGATAALAITATACGGANAGQGGSGLKGSVTIDGSSTVAPISTVAAELFMKKNPGVKITVGTSGTGGGFEKFCRGKTDISDASRPISDKEAAICEKNGISYEQFTIANDALSVIVSQQNTWAKCLTVEQLKKIWKPGSKVKTWNQVDPSFPKKPIKLFGPGTDSGTFDYFTEKIVGEEGASRTDYSKSEDDNVIVRGVSGSKGGLGYLGYSYYEENKDKLNAVAIDSGNGCVQPSPANAQSGRYEPLSRPLFIYPKKASMKKPAVEAFMQYYVDNAKTIAKKGGFIPLNDQQMKELKSKLDKLQK